MIDLYWEPRKVALEKIEKVVDEPEMSEFESAFLCGLIRKFKPRKILEIGVAAGGTTAIILQCLDLLGYNKDVEFISVDLNKKFYRTGDRDTGFLASEIKKKLGGETINHRFLLGKVLPEVIDSIGGEIDLVILDTVHFLPGEVLDFPVLLPFLSSEACVILHDIAYHHYTHHDGCSNGILMSAIVADKVIPMDSDKDKTTGMPNIGAFIVNENTRKYIENVFYSMTLPWHYMPSEEALTTYRQFYQKYYPNDIVDLFEVSVDLNTKSINKKNKLSWKERISRCKTLILRGY